MGLDSESKYYHAFAAIVKITLRDGFVNENETEFLKHLAGKLRITIPEYEEIMDDGYMFENLVPPLTYKSRINSLYELAKIISGDPTISGDSQLKWLQRIAAGIGFNPSNTKYIADKAIALKPNSILLDEFEEEIRHMNR